MQERRHSAVPSGLAWLLAAVSATAVVATIITIDILTPDLAIDIAITLPLVVVALGLWGMLYLVTRISRLSARADLIDAVTEARGDVVPLRGRQSRGAS